MRGGDKYRCQAATLEGFIQQLAVAYVRNGYFYFVTGRVPPDKEPREVDDKLVAKYGVVASKWVRSRRKRAGLANVQYLRFDRFFVLLATKGEHPFFAAEGASVRDCRRVPIKFGGYSVSYRAGHACVRIEREQYGLLLAHFLDLATRRPSSCLASMLATLPFEPYAPVRRQLLGLLRAVNKARRSAGQELVPWSCLRLRRRVLRPFTLGDPGRDRTDLGRARARSPSSGPKAGVTGEG